MIINKTPRWMLWTSFVYALIWSSIGFFYGVINFMIVSESSLSTSAEIAGWLFGSAFSFTFLSIIPLIVLWKYIQLTKEIK